MKHITFLWPCALAVLAAVGAVVYSPTPPVLIGTLVATNVVWIIVVGIQATRFSKAQQRIDKWASQRESATSIKSHVYQIVDRINLFIDEEVLMLDESLKQIEGLAKDAVSNLAHSLHSLKHQVTTQSRLLNQLAGVSTPGAERGNKRDWGQVVDDYQSVIQYFLSLLDEVTSNHESVTRSFEQIDTRMRQARQVLDRESYNKLADLRRAVADMQGLLKKQQLEHSGAREQAQARSAVERIEETRSELHKMRDVVAMNVEAFKSQSQKDMGRAVQSLQFEDIVTQLVAGAKARLDEMNSLVRSLKERVERLEVIEADIDVDEVLSVVETINLEVVGYTDKLRSERHRPVAQTSMEEGSIELF